jgi:hypothetical protein
MTEPDQDTMLRAFEDARRIRSRSLEKGARRFASRAPFWQKLVLQRFHLAPNQDTVAMHLS